VKALIDEAKRAGFTYQRFHDREDLRPLMREALLRMLAEEFGLRATSDEAAEGEQQVESASRFESAILNDTSVATLDDGWVNRFAAAVGSATAGRVTRRGSEALLRRGLAIRARTRNQFHPTTAAYVLFSPHPANRFPQCEILVDAYEGDRITGRPKGQAGINAPLPGALEQVMEFIDRHTFHPRRVVGLNNVRLDEYPTAALREALVNAVAHRNYEDAGRKIFVRLFRDRIEIASPGYPLKPLTPARLRRGGYRPCSRNPMIAQALATLALMEQRGTGFARMREAMLDHGLDEPRIEQQDGFFVVTLSGPAGDYDRIKTAATVSGPVTPAVEARLNERQKRIMLQVAREGTVTRGWCVAEFGVANDTAGRDLKGLTELGLLVATGKGRAVRYLAQSTDNRPIR
jgi:predicted HTH transcriptional regulator